MLTTDYSDDTDMKNLCACNPKDGVSNHEIHESHEKRTACNAMSVHPAGERSSVGISLSFRVFRGFNCCFQVYASCIQCISWFELPFSG